jgi:hypothetical protein
MSKKVPALEGGVSRAIDFNLKKEDLMLLILEGRKENMEEEISKIQTISINLRKEVQEVQEELKKRVSKLCFATIMPETRRIAKAFGNISEKEKDIRDMELNELSLGESFKLELDAHDIFVEYTRFSSQPIGDGKNGTYIKQQSRTRIGYQLYDRMNILMNISLYGKTFVKHSDIIRNKDVRTCSEYSRSFSIAQEPLNLETQRELPETKKLHSLVEKLAINESLLSDILAEYDLFNRNQPRSKAKMIKEVLARDEQGLALLDNIMTAASNVKLIVAK